MTSSAGSVNDTLAGYLAGRVTAEAMVAVVAATYWEPGAGSRERFQPMMEIIERAHPGVVTLAAAEGRPGFAIQLSGRPFPKQYEDQLRQAVQAVIDQAGRTAPSSLVPAPSLFTRILRAVRSLFSA